MLFKIITFLSSSVLRNHLYRFAGRFKIHSKLLGNEQISEQPNSYCLQEPSPSFDRFISL